MGRGRGEGRGDEGARNPGEEGRGLEEGTGVGRSGTSERVGMGADGVLAAAGGTVTCAGRSEIGAWLSARRSMRETCSA
jgi:hypothetical protein